MVPQHRLMEVRPWSTARVAATLYLALALAGCSLLGGASPPPEPTVIHVVRFPGETLGVISAWYTGTPNRWNEIQSANANLDVRKIRIGQSILVPARLVKNRVPLTAEAIARIERRIAGRGEDDALAWREAEDTTYEYPVRTISGCADLANSLQGLHECANRIGKSVRITPASHGG